MRKRLFIATVIFVVSFIIGFLLFKNMFWFDDLEKVEIVTPNFWKIFINNSCVCIFLIIGIGVITVPLGAYQGFQLGAMLSIWLNAGNPITGYILLTIPHCIFEIPALVISIALGLYSGSELLVFYKNKSVNLKEYIREIKKWLFVIIVLLIVAAIVETFITGNVYNRYYV